MSIMSLTHIHYTTILFYILYYIILTILFPLHREIILTKKEKKIILIVPLILKNKIQM